MEFSVYPIYLNLRLCLSARRLGAATSLLDGATLMFSVHSIVGVFRIFASDRAFMDTFEVIYVDFRCMGIAA